MLESYGDKWVFIGIGIGVDLNLLSHFGNNTCLKLRDL